MATLSSPPSRALRVGVLLGGNLVEERLFKAAGSISIGQSLRSSLSIPADGVPFDHVLFAAVDGRIVLRLTERMTGRLSQGGAIRTELRSGTPIDGIWTIPVERGARGKLQIGDATILFQEVVAPPVAPRPQLPASVRGGFADRIDRRLAVIVASSLLLHLGIGSWAWMTELAGDEILADPLVGYEPPSVEQIDYAPEPPVVEPAPVDGEGTEPAVAPPVAPVNQTPRPIVPKPSITQLPEPLDVDKWAQVMTGNTPGVNGHDEIKKRLPGTALDGQIKDIRDNDREVRVGNNDRTSREQDIRRGNGPKGPEIDGPALDQIPKKAEEPIARLRPIPGPPMPNPPTLTSGIVLGRIQNAYMAGLKRCYVKHGLAFDASMVAKVTLTFVVDERGQTTESSARGANPEVDSCIGGQMSSWTFPVPKDKDGDPTEVAFKILLALQPS